MKNSLMLFAGVLCAWALVFAATALQDGQKRPDNIYEIEVRPMASDTERADSLKPYEGEVLLLVNVASRCGFTRQYAGLQEIHEKYADRGLRVLGFPCNQFGGQEPGTEQEIVQFCESKFGVDFPLYAKLDVNGEDRAPLYRFLAGEGSPYPGDIKWNFEKFLVGRDGKIIARYPSKVNPTDPELVAAIEKALAADSGETDTAGE